MNQSLSQVPFSLFKKSVPGIVLLFLLAAFPPEALSGSFSTSPIKIFLDSVAKTTEVKILNNGQEKVTVQLDAKSWRQDEAGAPVYAKTKELIFFPKIAEIEAGQERIVRIGFKGKMGVNEKAYRLFIEELPDPKPGEVGVSFAVVMGLPVFVTPKIVVEGGSIASLAFKAGRIAMRLKNDGNKHIMAGKIKFLSMDAAGKNLSENEIGGWYLLPGTTTAYSSDVPKETCLKAATMQVSVTIIREGRDGNREKVLTEKIPVDAKECVEIAKAEEAPGEEVGQ